LCRLVEQSTVVSKGNSQMPDLSLPIENRLLAALPIDDYQRLLPYLEKIALKLRQVLYDAGDVINYVYFPNKALISLVSRMKNGASAEVGMVGSEGMVSTSVFMGGKTIPYQAIVQGSDGAMKLHVATLIEEFNRGGALQTLLLRYTQALHIQVSQTAACNRLHSLDERLARWLLMTHDRVQSDRMELTQEFLSTMLGVERSGVTLAAITLQNEGLIKYSRGKITVLDRIGLERASCECYDRVKIIFDELLKV
jgi:CRP-like cAMP-binding protein